MSINTPTGGDEELKLRIEGLTDEQKRKLLEMLKQEKKEKTENNVEKSKIPQELKDFRKTWRKKWKVHPETTIEKIVNAAEKIKVKVETEGDGSRLIKFSLNGKKYRILDPKLITHSDERYLHKYHGAGELIIPGTVYATGMVGDEVENWENQKLKEYVKEKQQQGLHIPKIEEIQLLLFELGKQANLDLGDLGGKIGMLSYLTGMDGDYLLSMGNDKSSGFNSWDSRSILIIDPSYANFESNIHYHEYIDNWQFCMFSCE